MVNIGFKIDTPRLETMKQETVNKYKKVLFLSMNKMEELAKRRCPVDSGTLKNSIKLEPMQEGATTYTLSDGVDYGVLVEYGTARMIAAHGPHDPENPVTSWEAKRKRNAQGQTMPFFRPAMLEVKRVWMPRFKKQVFNK